MANYTDEINARFEELYTADRNENELLKTNAVLLEEIAAELNDTIDNEDDKFSVASLRAKAMNLGFYVKDTDAEKEAIAKARESKPKEKKARVTKSDRALKILDLFGLDRKLADDLAKVKVDTLAALETVAVAFATKDG